MSPLDGRWAGASIRDTGGGCASWPGWADDGDPDLPQEHGDFADGQVGVASDVPDSLDGFEYSAIAAPDDFEAADGFGYVNGLEAVDALSGPDCYGAHGSPTGIGRLKIAREIGFSADPGGGERPVFSPDLGPSADPDLGFGPGGSSERMPPGLALHARVEEAADRLGGMSDEGVVEVAAAARRLRARAEHLELQATREFTRRRWESDPEPVKTRDGKWRLAGGTAEHAADELAFRLVEDRRASEDRMALSLALRDRLPRMAAMLAAGKGDAYRCQVVNDMTATLSDDDTRLVDELVAPEAPELRYTALRRLVAKLALRLDPDADRERREQATRKKARVEKFQEQSGNWALAGREVPLGEVLASEAHIEGLARYLRSQGVPGSLRELKTVIFFDLTQGRDPRTRIPGVGTTAGHDSAPGHGTTTGHDSAPEHDGTGNRDSRGTGASRDEHASRTNDQEGPGCQASKNERGSDAASCDLHVGDARDGQDDATCRSWGHVDHDARNEDSFGEGFADSGFGDSYAGAVSLVDDDPDDDAPEVSDGSGGSRPWPFGQPGHCKPDGRTPFPASINLLVPVGTAYGWSSMPGEAGREIIDPRTLREMIQSASRHRRTRWCVTLVDGQDGTAVAHGCARGQHTWDPPPASPGPPHPPDPLSSEQGAGNAMPADCAPDAAQAAARLRDPVPAPTQLDQVEEFLRKLNIAFTPIAKGDCDHQQAEARYRPSRRLRHLILARDATCPAPGCGASSLHSDLDHTEHWPHGPTCQCNLGAPCRHHHRTKQAPGWTLEQPQPGVFKWTTPSRHVYYTGPTRYGT